MKIQTGILKNGCYERCFKTSRKTLVTGSYFSENAGQQASAILKTEFPQVTQREKCPNTKLFLVRIFLYSDR